jgi:sulfatase maturation enzyme AslB (radical SAM superfamily)
MSKFQPLQAYEKTADDDYRLLPFRFTVLGDDRYVLTNIVGEHLVLSREMLQTFARHKLPANTPEFRSLKSRHFLLDGDSDVAIDLLALKTKTKYERLANFTALHLFVVTLRCEHSCPYCQVSRKNEEHSEFDMSLETANRAVDLVFRSPSPSLKIEFQGGEPLLNFGLSVRPGTLGVG